MSEEGKAWVEADRAVKDHARVIGYSVWVQPRRQRLVRFSANRDGGWEAALHLANTYRDDYNAKIE